MPHRKPGRGQVLPRVRSALQRHSKPSHLLGWAPARGKGAKSCKNADTRSRTACARDPTCASAGGDDERVFRRTAHNQKGEVDCATGSSCRTRCERRTAPDRRCPAERDVRGLVLAPQGQQELGCAARGTTDPASAGSAFGTGRELAADVSAGCRRCDHRSECRADTIAARGRACNAGRCVCTGSAASGGIRGTPVRHAWSFRYRRNGRAKEFRRAGFRCSHSTSTGVSAGASRKRYAPRQESGLGRVGHNQPRSSSVGHARRRIDPAGHTAGAVRCRHDRDGSEADCTDGTGRGSGCQQRGTLRSVQPLWRSHLREPSCAGHANAEFSWHRRTDRSIRRWDSRVQRYNHVRGSRSGEQPS
ncbi:hypothetical protein VAR608DRAFT_1040 [Variovorax sp. HW608]|nr:hypothetical protein VAR608DRAFT_1040 [Variovorax sp. HW608]